MKPWNSCTVFPRAKIESVDDQAHQKGSLLVYGMTFTALVDENNHPYYIYRAKPTETVDCNLSALTVGTLRLSPTFSAGNVSYTAETSSSSSVVTAAANDSDATVTIKNGSTTVNNGSAASWSAGENVLTVTVTNGNASKVYTVTVTKS